MRLPEVRFLRWLYLAMALLAGMVSVYVWTDRSSATDWFWLYRVGLPISTAAFAWRAFRPRVVGTSAVFVPLSLIAVARVVDFAQDWWLTPEVVEPVDIVDRALLASFGWGAIVVMALMIHVFERLLMARWGDNDLGCLNAPDCPRRVDPVRSPIPL